jgi:hypothetical protein
VYIPSVTTLVETLVGGDELIHKRCIFCEEEVLLLVQGKQITWIERGRCHCVACVVQFDVKAGGLR